MRGSAFCYFHGRAPRPTRPARSPEANIEVSPVVGSRGCARAVNQIMQALAANRISSRRAAILLQGAQMASGLTLPGPIGLDAPLGNTPLKFTAASTTEGITRGPSGILVGASLP